MFKLTFEQNLRRNKYKGLYVVIEGIDGSGKSTQAERLKKYFEKKGKEVVITSEPQKESSVTGKLIHQILQAKIKIPSRAFQYLYSADRAINHENIIIPALKRGAIVLSHRSFWSNVPYGMLDIDIADFNHQHADPIIVAHGMMSYYYQFIAADYSFYLDVSVETVVGRLKKMHKKKEIYETGEKLARIEKGYRWIINQFKDEIIVVDGEKTVEEVTDAIRKYIVFSI